MSRNLIIAAAVGIYIVYCLSLLVQVADVVVVMLVIIIITPIDVDAFPAQHILPDIFTAEFLPPSVFFGHPSPFPCAAAAAASSSAFFLVAVAGFRVNQPPALELRGEFPSASDANQSCVSASYRPVDGRSTDRRCAGFAA
jgi:hypothetical protein